jgi:hypothetical protein
MPVRMIVARRSCSVCVSRVRRHASSSLHTVSFAPMPWTCSTRARKWRMSLATGEASSRRIARSRWSGSLEQVVSMPGRGKS